MSDPVVELHSEVGPSVLGRVRQCPGSVRLSRLYPEAEGPEAGEGIAAHWGLAERLHGRDVTEGQIAGNGVVLDAEMLEAIEVAADEIIGTGNRLNDLNVERMVQIPAVHAKCFGTPDADRWVSSRHLKVWDFKYGHGYVDEYRNAQLIAYASGIASRAKIDGLAEQTTTVDLTVIQPRHYGAPAVRTYTTTLAMMRADVNILHMAAEQALDVADPQTIAGPECRYCPARHACPTLQKAALSVVDTVGRAIALDLATPHAAAELRRLDYADGLLSARRSGLEQQLLGAARKGEAVPFYHVKHGDGRERWAKPVAEVIALGTMYGVDLRGTPKAITPAAARKLGVDVPGFSERSSGAATLVADSPAKAAKVFAK